MTFADLPGVRLWYTDSGGAGPPLVLLHANTGNVEIWEPNVSAFATAGYRVVAFDRRGWGQSTADPGTGPQPGTIADDLDALAYQLKLDRFHLVGVAGGGYGAYDFALRYPEQLRSLVVAASGGGISEAEYARIVPRIRLPGFMDWPVEFREVSPAYMALHPDGLQQWLAIDSRSRQEDAPAQLLGSPITWERLQTITVPTLILAAESDLYAPPYAMRTQAQHIPGAEFGLISEAGHAVNWEQPEAFNTAVLEFLHKH